MEKKLDLTEFEGKTIRWIKFDEYDYFQVCLDTGIILYVTPEMDRYDDETPVLKLYIDVE